MARTVRRHSPRARFALKAVPAVVALSCVGMQTPAQALDLARFEAADGLRLAPGWAASGAQWRPADLAIINARNAHLSFAAALAALNPAAAGIGLDRLRASGWGYAARRAPSDDAIALTWFGGTGDWMVAANWSPSGGPPGADDTATINAGNAQLGVDTAIGGLAMGGGQVSGSGKLTVSGASQWTGGAHNGVGTSQFDATLAISGANDKNLGGGRVIGTTGTTTWSGNTAANNNRIVFSGGTINNSGTWNDANAFDSYVYSYSGTNAFNNAGSYNKQNATTTTMDVVYNNSGTTNVDAGRFKITGGSTSSSAGQYKVAADAVLDFNTGTHNLNTTSITGDGTTEISGSSGYNFVNLNGGTLSTALLLSGGNLQGSDHTLLGPVTWTGTVIRGAASTNVASTLAITGANDKNLSGGRVLNVGDTTWSGNTATNNNRIVFSGGTINNSGTWNDANAFDSYVYSYSGTNAFNNAGTFDKQKATTTTMDVVYNNTGTTNVDAGRFKITGGSTSSSAGQYKVAASAVLDFNTGTHNLNTTSITGDGTTEISGSSGYNFVNLNGGTLSTALLLSGGNLQGSDHTLLGPVTWTGTVIRGAASTNVASSLDITGANDKNLSGGRVLNVGDTTWSGNTAANNNRIVFSGGTINNSGTWNDANAFDSYVYSYSGSNAFNNAGSYNKQNATTTTMDVVYNNTGTTNVDAGRFKITGGSTSSSAGQYKVAAGAVLDFNTGTHNLNTTSITGDGTTEISGSSGYNFVNLNGGTLSTALLLSGGVLMGADHTLLGPVTWTGSNISGAASTNFASTLAITGANDKNAGSGRVLNVADTTWSGNTAANNNRIRFTGATINNSGTWNDANAFDSYVYSYSGTNAFNNAGSYNKQNATTTTMDVVYNNTGTTNVDAGRFKITGGSTSSSAGQYKVAAGAVLDFNTGTHNLNTTSITGDGMTEISGSSGYSFVNLNGGTLSTALLLSGGVLMGADHTLLGPVTWTGSNISGAASTTFASTLAITGANDKNVGSGRVLNTEGTTTWSGNTASDNNRIRFTGATINNTGTWNDSNAFNAYTYNYSGTNAFNNAGTYNKQGNTTTTMGVAYNNTGTTNVEAGTLVVNPAFTNHGLVQTAPGATFLGSNATFVNAGILAGDGTIATHANGDIVNQGGAIDPGINGIGHLNVTGALVNAATGKLNFELASLASFDTLAVSDDVSLGGEIGVWNLGYTPVLGDSFVVMTFAAQADANPFDSIGVYGFAPGTEFTAIYNPHDVTLTVSAVAAVPEPQTLMLMLAGLGVIGFIARRRRA